jgi:very-short-patch-repair endonuclease
LHEWEAVIDNRSQGNGCPICDSKRVLIGFNDLGTINPKLAAEWHPTKNEGITPESVTPGSNRKVWWICDLSHEWETAVKNRSKGHGCPYCSSNLVLVGYNDLKTLNPGLAAQWHPVLNQDVTPHDVTVSSQRKVWWICSLLHSWEAKVSSRTVGNDCPYCSGNSVLRGFNDLATTNPTLAAEWHPRKNGTIIPQDVTAGSRKSVWWVCSLFHEWEALIINRSKGNGCPYCSGNRVLIGFNDLKTIKPELISQWHPTKNGKLMPQDVTVSASKKVWWICVLSHEWEAKVASRSKGSGCSICDGKRVQIGFNDLMTCNPILAAQWHPTRNGMLTPSNVTVSSGKKVWWICSMSHEWETTVNARSYGYGCPKCSAGITEGKFRDAFEKISSMDFASNRIKLVRFSRKLDRAQIDMINDDLKLVIEYDGEWTHGANGPEGKTLERKLAEDKETTQALVDIGYRVIRIREHDKNRQLPFIPFDAGYEDNVFQISYKSFGKEKDDIEALAKKIIEANKEWFKTSNEITSVAVC